MRRGSRTWACSITVLSLVSLARAEPGPAPAELARARDALSRDEPDQVPGAIELLRTEGSPKSLAELADFGAGTHARTPARRAEPGQLLYCLRSVAPAGREIGHLP